MVITSRGIQNNKPPMQRTLCTDREDWSTVHGRSLLLTLALFHALFTIIMDGNKVTRREVPD